MLGLGFQGLHIIQGVGFCLEPALCTRNPLQFACFCIVAETQRYLYFPRFAALVDRSGAISARLCGMAYRRLFRAAPAAEGRAFRDASGEISREKGRRKLVLGGAFAGQCEDQWG